MSAYLVAPQRSAVPSPTQLMAYLRAQGWALVDDPGKRWALFQHPFQGQPAQLEVPLLEDARDYPRTLQACLEDLSQLLQRNMASLLREVLAEGKDMLRLHSEGPTLQDGQLSLEAGRGLYQGARDLLLAVASSVVDSKPVFPSRKPSKAVELVKRARLGQPEHGSFVLVIENEVPPMLGQLALTNATSFSVAELPFARRVTMRYSESMAALSHAMRNAQAKDDLAPMLAAVEQGVSANLCEAVALILQATQAERLTASAIPSPRWPLPPGYRTPSATVSAHSLPFLREVAKTMRKEALYADTTIEGPVVKLQSEDATQGGTFAVRAQLDNTPRTIWVKVDPCDYVLATNAHRDGDLLRLSGDLKRDGRWHLLHPRQLRVIPLESAGP